MPRVDKERAGLITRSILNNSFWRTALNSRDEITSYRGSRQGPALHLDPPPHADPYAHWEVQFDDETGILLPFRKIPPKRKSLSGYVPFQSMERVIWHESWLEQQLLLGFKHLEKIPEILEQPMSLNMKALGFRGVRYHPDFLVWGPGIRPTLIEVKYECDLRKNWKKLKPKLQAGRRYAEWRGWNFRLVTDRHLHPEGIQRIEAPKTGLICPYKRTPLTEGAAKVGPRAKIWGAMPGKSEAHRHGDRTHLLIPPTQRLMGRLLWGATHE